MIKLEVKCECNEDFHKHVCYHECPDAFEYDGVGANNPAWQG
jgi:ferredoxin